MKKRVIVLSLIMSSLVVGRVAAQTKVGVTRDITWREYPSGLQVTNVSIQILKADLGLFNNKFKVRYLIGGQVRHDKSSLKPRIKQIHYTEQLIRKDEGGQQKCGKVDITPLVEFKEDKTYRVEWVPFSLQFDKWMQTYTWGSNVYMITCGSITTNMSVVQMK